MKVFITSTLSNDYNLKLNPKLGEALEQQGFTVYLPQRDTNQKGAKEEIGRQNKESIKDADLSIVVLTNPTVNLGAEAGFAHGLGKPTIGLANKGDFIHWMLEGMINEIIKVDNLMEVDQYVDMLISKLRSLSEEG